MRLLTVVAVLVSLMVPAQAVDSSWMVTGDRQWRIGTDVWEPGHYATYYTTGFAATVPHKGAYRNEVKKYGSSWGTRRYTLIGELERFQAKNSTWWFYSDAIHTTYQPQSPSSTTSYFWFYNPNGSPYQTSVPVSPNWNQCDAEMYAYDHYAGLQRGPLVETHLYRVLNNGS